jgi:hypothetical protein
MSELTPTWRKSSYTEGGTSSQCVEVARLDAEIGIRDSKARDAGHLTVSGVAFADLLARIKADDLAV